MNLNALTEFIEQNKGKQELDAPVGPPIRELSFPNNFRFASWPEREENFRMDAIGFIEQFYYEHKSLPSKADFEIRFTKRELPKSFSEWKEFLLSIKEPLENRGIPTYEVNPGYLEPEFVTAVSSVLNYHDRRSTNAKLKELGISSKRWNAWLKLPEHLSYYKARLEEIVDQESPLLAKKGLNELMANGDLQAIKHYHEVSNIYRPHSGSNALLILQAIMEILPKYIEAEVINKIALELRSSSVIQGELSNGQS